MERIPVEVLYLLGFAAFVLFNVFAQRAARRRQQQEQAEAQAAPQALPEDEPLEDIWGRAPRPPPAAAPAPLSPPRPSMPAVPRRIHPVRALLKDRRDLRRAVVLAMVLGPCRAQQPPER